MSRLLKKVMPLLFLLVVLLSVYGAYQPGLKGGFLFDDYPNLEDMGTYGGVRDFDTFKSFVFGGISGPLGRPIALASFLLDDNTWPSNAQAFKLTNLKIHMLAGLFLCWATILLMRLLKYSESSAVWIGLISAAVWLLHPFMVSTTLYVVQRMAQLAALFMFIGLVGYFHGRLLIVRGFLKTGYWWMSISLASCTVLAMLSKENGILLPMSILIIEFCLSQNLPPLSKRWQFLFLWAPTFAVIYILLSRLQLTNEAFPGRTFSPIERMMTQPRIIWEYLYNLYVPHIEGRGLYQDGYLISRGLLQPKVTILAIVGIVMLVVGAIKIRKIYPLISIALLFFFVNQLLESTWINLELYFEHRNYSAAAFMFLPLAAGSLYLFRKINPKLAGFCLLAVFALLYFFTWKRSTLWSSSEQLELYWAVSTPNSARAQNRLATWYIQNHQINTAIDLLRNANDEFKTSGLLTVNLLLVKVYAGEALESDFLNAAERLRYQPFDAQALKGVRTLVEKISEPDTDIKYAQWCVTLLEIMRANDRYDDSLLFKKLSYYLQGLLNLKLEKFDQAFQNFSKAMALYMETDSALSMVADMGNAARPDEALLLLHQAENIYKNQPERSLIHSKEIYDSEFKKLRDILEQASKSMSDAQ